METNIILLGIMAYLRKQNHPQETPFEIQTHVIEDLALIKTALEATDLEPLTRGANNAASPA